MYQKKRNNKRDYCTQMIQSSRSGEWGIDNAHENKKRHTSLLLRVTPSIRAGKKYICTMTRSRVPLENSVQVNFKKMTILINIFTIAIHRRGGGGGVGVVLYTANAHSTNRAYSIHFFIHQIASLLVRRSSQIYCNNSNIATPVPRVDKSI